MAFKRTDLALFWTLPPDALDWQNVAISGVKRMQLVAAFADLPTLSRLRDIGITGVAVRLDEAGYATVAARARSRDFVAPLVPLGVDTVIVGVEPEHTFDLQYGSATWGMSEAGAAAFAHAHNLSAMLQLLRPLGVRVSSPGCPRFAHARAKDMNWREGLFPGEQSWLEITREAYHACDLNAFHWYSYDGTGYDVMERMRRTLWLEQCRRHKSLYIDELGADRGTPVDPMRTYLHLATLLLDTTSNNPFALSGMRVEGLAPFVSNGNGVGWDRRYLIRDPAAYALVARFMAGDDF